MDRGETGATRWFVSQFGAREHYAVARALSRNGRLAIFYTDAWCRFGRGLLQRGPMSLRAFAERWHDDLRGQRVTAFTPRTILSKIRHDTANEESRALEELQLWKVYSGAVRDHLSRIQLDPATDVFFGFYNASLEILEVLAERGIFRIVDQADPGEVEENLVMEERERWPGWEPPRPRVPDILWNRQRQEWQLADRVLVNSEWSKAGLTQQGLHENKVVVVPLAYEAQPDGMKPRVRVTGPLTVLWLGSVILRKGIPYLFEAARLLAGYDLRFVVAGPIEITEKAVAATPPNVSFVGRVTRDEASRMYRSAHAFVLPTISDGFAITQIEALAHGLPVITTPNCGKAVRQGVDGFVVPVRDGRALADALLRLDDDRRLLEEMSANAVERSKEFSLERLGDALERLVLK